MNRNLVVVKKYHYYVSCVELQLEQGRCFFLNTMSVDLQVSLWKVPLFHSTKISESAKIDFITMFFKSVFKKVWTF